MTTLEAWARKVARLGRTPKITGVETGDLNGDQRAWIRAALVKHAIDTGRYDGTRDYVQCALSTKRVCMVHVDTFHLSHIDPASEGYAVIAADGEINVTIGCPQHNGAQGNRRVRLAYEHNLKNSELLERMPRLDYSEDMEFLD